MTAEDIVALWKDPAHWKHNSFYFCKEDPRVFVPKRNPQMGWTLNFSKKSAIPTLLGVIAFLLVPIAFVPRHAIAVAITVPLLILLDMAVVVGLCIYFSSPERAARRKQR